ncbi:hypothetical protein OU790_18220 [Ruegeria sp. NA]|nr:hypothetical protein [Ruegeria sp. NA]MCX8955363.1 hypothetical protein [Ruegeria sp. NA]
MHITIEQHGNLTCDIEADKAENLHTGTLKYNSFEVGRISGSDLSTVRAQFRLIASLVDERAQVRHGIIVCGYHNGDLRGDVLLVDGESIESWYMDDEEWSYFTVDGEAEPTCAAPSAWLMHDAIAEWHTAASQ